MVTWFRSQEALPVRARALHPVLVVLAFILFGLGFTVFVSASEWDLPVEEYILIPDSNLYDLVQPYASIPGNSVFGVFYNESPYGNKISYVTDIPSSQLDQINENDSYLFWYMFKMFNKAETAVNAVDARVDGIEQNALTILDLYDWTNADSNVEHSLAAAYIQSLDQALLDMSVPDLLALVTQNQYTSYKGLVAYMVNSSTPAYSTSAGNLGTGRSVAGLVALLSQNQYNQYLRLNTLLSNANFGASTISTGTIGTGRTVGDLLAMLSSNDVMQYNRLNALLTNQSLTAYDLGTGSLSVGTGISDILALSTRNQRTFANQVKAYVTANGTEYQVLGSNGKLGTGSSTQTLYTVTRAGFSGLANLLLPSTQPVSVDLIDPTDPLSPLRTDKYSSLIPLLAFMAQTEQNLLTKLQFVLANDEDIKMKQNEAPNQEAAIDGFFGSGQGAVVPADISDTASIAGSVKSTFAGAGSAGDAFAVLNSGDTYSFFSQAVSDDLNGDPMISTHDINDDSWLEGFDVDEDGYLHLKPSSMFDVSLYLEELLG